MTDESYNCTMLPRRVIRITAILLALGMALTVSLGYDLHAGTNITETFFEPYIE